PLHVTQTTPDDMPVPLQVGQAREPCSVMRCRPPRCASSSEISISASASWPRADPERLERLDRRRGSPSPLDARPPKSVSKKSLNPPPPKTPLRSSNWTLTRPHPGGAVNSAPSFQFAPS